MKTLIILLLPIPLVIWPIVAAVGSIVTGLGYGIGQPLVATFEAVGEGRKKKFYHAFAVRRACSLMCSTRCLFLVYFKHIGFTETVPNILGYWFEQSISNVTFSC